MPAMSSVTRTITDGGAEFDRIPDGYQGPLYAEVCPRSFSVLVRAGQRLNQIRFRSGQSVLTDPELVALNSVEPLVSGEAMISEGLGFSVDLRPASGDLVGYRAKPHTGVIDLDKIAHYPAQEFWEEVRTTEGRIILDPGAFYILVSREAVTIPPDHAAEMAPYLAMVGEFRVHYAGFFDPGFGYAGAGGRGALGRDSAGGTLAAACAVMARDGVWYRPSAYGDPYPITRALLEDGRDHLLLHAPRGGPRRHPPRSP
mgnify:CR=1 FL=1